MNLVDVERHARGVTRLVMTHRRSPQCNGRGVARGSAGGSFTAFAGCVLPGADPRIGTEGLFQSAAILSRMDTLSASQGGARSACSPHTVLARLLLAADKPMIAEVGGYAMGAGAGLALMCDTVVMGENAALGFPFPKVRPRAGFRDCLHAVPAGRIGGLARAKQALLYARTYKGADAMALGLADDVVADDLIAKKAMERAMELAALPSHALALTKRMMEQSADPHSVLEFEVMAQALCFATNDFREGVAAFREKRKPDFDGTVQ